MKYLAIALVALCSPFVVFCQDITGLWKGTLFNNDTQQTLPYEILIKKEKGKLTGYSQTWFLINDIKYYGVKMVKIRMASDGKIVIQDARLIENNYPSAPNKNLLQLNILDFVTHDNEAMLNGAYVTNTTRSFSALSGNISLKRVSASVRSSLVEYLQKNNIDNDVSTVVK